jgi:hypothetical protein
LLLPLRLYDDDEFQHVRSHPTCRRRSSSSFFALFSLVLSVISNIHTHTLTYKHTSHKDTQKSSTNNNIWHNLHYFLYIISVFTINDCHH